MLADGLGRPLRFRITAVQAHDITAASALLEVQEAGAVLADKAYDSNELRETIARMEAQAVIPSKRNRIERCFGRLKHFRGFATRYDRRTVLFAGFIHLAAAMIWLR